MDLGLKDKVAIICASSKGLGRAAASAIAAEGAKVALCARGDAALKQAARQIGGDVFTRALDVRDAAAMKRFVADVAARWGAVHILVNNCGGPTMGPTLKFDDAAWAEAVDMSFLASVRWTREVAPIMMRQKWGRIINIASISVKQPIPNLVLSNAARAALIGFAKTISRELAPHNVLVNNVLPGTHLTDRILEMADERGETPEEVAGRYGRDIPVGHVGRPEDFGPLVAFLASERASYICGASILIDGGAFAGMM